VEKAHDYVLRNIHLGARFVGIYRQDVYELPPDSIRELIINAVMNCSFLQNSHIQVAIYDDRLEITSPGGLLPGVTIQKMQEGYSKIRNKALAHAFLYMNMIEEWGSGIPKHMREMKEYGLREPEFIDMEIGFRVNLYRKQYVATSQETNQETFNTSQETNKPSQETNKKVYNTSQEMNQDEIPETELSSAGKIRTAIAGNPSVTQKELQELTGLSRSGVRYILQQMRSAGKLDRIGSTKNGKWILKE
jgi:ATP-dependent DNA helicase RecG